ncbi:uncharacterized protein EI90DRAFT_3154952 [Cantharellus anzutake]|uniref:uncharacterized protein n=1 Tax=Cantharellus anzutake TaxID=1750568 RepID=UPI0019062910|nr:uncharacterized protein EI90DRAFT_3154952 [Cantharellus anzutake]KAF8330322.1 hypothetical protein EI90DRAFT_3154952 [Cantharellus anzutake]
MTPKRKRPESASAQDIFDKISGNLIQIKDNLGHPNLDPSSTIEMLDQVAALAESFSQSSKTKKSLQPLMDTLDREGVNLWNLSTFLKDGSEVSPVYASLRFAAFSLIEAGTEARPSTETLVHILQIASKAGSALAGSFIWHWSMALASGDLDLLLVACGRVDTSTQVLSRAAIYEKLLQESMSSSDIAPRDQAAAIAAYYIGRMEAAWKDGNQNVSYFMLQQAIDQQRLAFLTVTELEDVAVRIWNIGRSILKAATDHDAGDWEHSEEVRKQAQLAVKWLKIAFQVVETRAKPESTSSAQDDEQRLGSLSDGEATVGALSMGSYSKSVYSLAQRAILRSLSRAYFISSADSNDNLSRAEASLSEAIERLNFPGEDRTESGPPPKEVVKELRQLQWMKTAILKRRNASDTEFREVLQGLLHSIEFSEECINDFLQEISALAEARPSLVADAARKLINHALRDVNGHSFIDKILLFLIFHLKADANQERATLEIRSACDDIAGRPDFQFGKVPARACQSVLWAMGDKLYNSNKWSRAVRWYSLSSHEIFARAVAPVTVSKCLRKTALCHIQLGEYSQAADCLRRCQADGTTNEAATHYVSFLAAIHQGLEDEAAEAITRLVNAPDFNRSMLLLATQLAHEKQLRRLLLSLLHSLLETLDSAPVANGGSEGIVLSRCIIRLTIDLLKEPAAEIPVLVDTLMKQLRKAKTLVLAAISKKDEAMIVKDLSWLWRTAYNCAIDVSTEWSSEIVAQLFDISREFLELFRNVSMDANDPVVHAHIVFASFSSISARVFAARQMNPPPKERLTITKDVKTLLSLVQQHKALISGEVGEERLRHIVHFVYLFQLEQLVKLADWEGVLLVIKDASASSLSLNLDTYEAIADILVRVCPSYHESQSSTFLQQRQWVEKECPSDVLYLALEVILHACLDSNAFITEKFSRWLRAICTILLARNGAADRQKALGFIEQAVEVIRDAVESSENGEVLIIPGLSIAFHRLFQEYPMDERQWAFTISYNAGVECLGANMLDEGKRWFECASMLSTFINSPGMAEKVSATYENLLNRYPPA